MTGLVDEERALNLVYLDFSKVLETVFCNDKLIKYRLGKRTIENE